MDPLFWLCSTALVCIILLWRTKLVSDDPRLPPKMSGSLPLIGHLHKFIGGPIYIWKQMQKIRKLCDDQGGTLTILFGPQQYTIISDPDDCLLVSNTCLGKDKMYDAGKCLIDTALIVATVDVWQRHRKILHPAYNQKILDGYIPTFNKYSRTLVGRLAAEVDKDGFDQTIYLKQTTLEIAFQTTVSLNELKENYMNKFADAVSYFIESRVLPALISFISYRIYCWTPLKAKDDKVIGLIHNLADTIIRDRRAELEKEISVNSSSNCRSVLDILLADESLTDLEIRDEVTTTIIASYFITPFAISSALLMVSSYPDVQQKVYEELNNIFEGSNRDVEKEDLGNLRYLDAVLMETLRLYPTFPFVTRYVNEDVKLKNYTLPAGTNCVMSLYSINRNSAWGPDADEFKPERWFKKNVPNNAFAAFSLGKRNCIGQKFAMMSMKTILCHILRNYTVHGDHTKVKTQFLVMIKPASGHEICIKKRIRKNKKDP